MLESSSRDSDVFAAAASKPLDGLDGFAEKTSNVLFTRAQEKKRTFFTANKTLKEL